MKPLSWFTSIKNKLGHFDHVIFIDLQLGFFCSKTLQVIFVRGTSEFNSKTCLVLQLNFEYLRLLESTCSAHTCVPGCPDDVIWWIRVTGQGIVQDGQDVVGGFDVVGEVLIFVYRKVL